MSPMYIGLLTVLSYFSTSLPAFYEPLNKPTLLQCTDSGHIRMVQISSNPMHFITLFFTGKSWSDHPNATIGFLIYMYDSHGPLLATLTYFRIPHNKGRAARQVSLFSSRATIPRLCYLCYEFFQPHLTSSSSHT